MIRPGNIGRAGKSVSAEIDRDRSVALARDTLGWLAQRALAPTPQHYTLVYSYLGSEHSGLKRTINGLIANGTKVDLNVMTVLYQRYFGAPKNDEAMADVGEKISQELESVVQLLDNATRDQSAYGKTLSKASGQLGDGNLPDAALKSMVDQMIVATRAIEARTKVLETQLQNSSHEVTELRERLETVRRESLTDQLTGISNRKAFDAELQQGIERAVEAGEPLSLLMCDIDHFKTFNDTWGHQTGDQVLRLVANCLSENVKGRDTAARYGGEEFAVILPQTALGDAVRLAGQIRGKVESKKLVKRSTGDILGVITISIGVTQLRPKEAPADLVRRADACLYAAKRAGRNRVMSEAEAGALAIADTAAA